MIKNPIFLCLTEEEYSLLSNLPEAAKLDENSDEFQNVVKSFYETIQDYHNKIRIIKVIKERTKGSLLCILNCGLPRANGENLLGGETHEPTAVQPVQAEESQHTAERHLPASGTDPLSRHERGQRERDLRPRI